MKETGTRRYDREPATLPRSQKLLLGSVLQWTDSHPTCDPLQLPVVQTCSIRQQRSAWVLMSCLCFEDSRRSVVGYRALAERSLFRLLIIALATLTPQVMALTHSDTSTQQASKASTHTAKTDDAVEAALESVITKANTDADTLREAARGGDLPTYTSGMSFPDWTAQGRILKAKLAASTFIQSALQECIDLRSSKWHGYPPADGQRQCRSGVQSNIPAW